MVLKKIELELYFDDEFMPPKKLRDDTSTSDNQCSWCPFFEWDDEMAQGECNLNIGIVDSRDRCPIRKFFETEEKES